MEDSDDIINDIVPEKQNRGQVMRRSKQNSLMQIINNPFELAALTKTQTFMKDNISDAVLIIDIDFKSIILGALNIIRYVLFPFIHILYIYNEMLINDHHYTL